MPATPWRGLVVSGLTWLWVLLAIAVIALLAVVLVRRARTPSGTADPPPAATGATAGEPEATAGPTQAASSASSTPDPAPAPTPDPAPAPTPDPAPEPEPAAAPARSSDPALAALDSRRVGATGMATPAGGVATGAAAAVPAAAVQPGPHPGSALPTADGSPPGPEFTIKANSGSKRFHDPESPYYVRTRADMWFTSAADAEQAGFAAWNGRPATH
jgi:outer membrane biosynthesis protein TonB